MKDKILLLILQKSEGVDLPVYHVRCRLVTAKTEICYICTGWLVEYSFRVFEKVNFLNSTSTHVFGWTIPDNLLFLIKTVTSFEILWAIFYR